MPRATPSEYLAESDLAAELRACQAAGRASDKLAKMLTRIAEGVWDRYRFPGTSRDEFAQHGVAALLGSSLRKVNPDSKPFGYLTTCLIWRGRDLAAKRARESGGPKAKSLDRVAEPTAPDDDGRTEADVATLSGILADFPRVPITTALEYSAAQTLADALDSRGSLTPKERRFADDLEGLLSAWEAREGLTVGTAEAV